MTARITCSIISTVTPSAASWRTTGIISSISAGFSPASTSSSNSSLGRVASARASSRRLRPHGQVGGGLVQLRAQVDAARDGLGGRQRVGSPRQAQVRAHGDVLAHRLRAKRLHDLEGARHAQARGAAAPCR